MTNAEILSMTKCNLSLIGNTWDGYLTNLIEDSRKEIKREGITLDETDIADCNLIVMYASYLYRKRAEDTAAMPRMLRYALNNRVIAEKGAV